MYIIFVCVLLVVMCVCGGGGGGGVFFNTLSLIFFSIKVENVGECCKAQ